MLLSFDIGGTFIKWALVDDYTVLEKGKVPTPQDSFESFLKIIEPIVKTHQVEGLAFSLPGTMNPEKTMIHIGGAIQYNNFREFPKEVSEYFDLPVTMENDANAAALAEIELGHLKESQNGLVIVIGTGVGAVYVHGKEIIRGSHGYGGEIGFLPYKDLYKNPFMECMIGETLGMKPFINKAKLELQNASLTGETFMKLVDENDIKAIQLIQEYMEVFSQMLFSLQIVYDPDCIVIGGGISSNPTYMNLLKEAFNKVASFCPLKMPVAKLESCTFYNDSNILGAIVAYHRQRNV